MLASKLASSLHAKLANNGFATKPAAGIHIINKPHIKTAPLSKVATRVSSAPADVANYDAAYSNNEERRKYILEDTRTFLTSDLKKIFETGVSL